MNLIRSSPIRCTKDSLHCLILRRPKPSYHVLQRLTEGGPEETVPGIAQYQDRRPAVRRRPVSWSRIRTNCTKSSSDTFPGGLASGGPAGPVPVSFPDEAPRQLAGHRDSTAQLQLVDAGNLQPLAGEPLAYRVGPRGWQVFVGGLCLTRSRLSDGCQATELIITGRGSVLGDAPAFGRARLLADRVVEQASARCNPAVSLR